jgi:hypothetical protein
MECCDVETIGTLTGVLAHFRCNRKGLTQRREDAKGLGGDWKQWWGLAWPNKSGMAQAIR